MAPPHTGDVFPCPVFEGSEKRISVQFAPSFGNGSPEVIGDGLRALTRTQLDSILDLAACQIVSSRHNDHFDAYVLSESSLFVYPDMLVLKTCGTTKLLDAVPLALEMAGGLGMTPTRVKYSRASFLFPDRQPAPHHGFKHECAVLHDLFSGLGSSSAYVLGDALNGLQWHVYVAAATPAGTTSIKPREQRALHTLEVCMTGLASEKAVQFVRGPEFVSAAHTSEMSGIAAMVPTHEIDDYVFEPCGYSMNGMGRREFSTVHITPEEGFSYASFEVCGHNPSGTTAVDALARCAAAFAPRYISLAVSAETNAPAADSDGWGASLQAPVGYSFHSASYQEVKCGGYVAYFTLERSNPPIGMVGKIAGARELEMATLKTNKRASHDVNTSSGSECSDSPRGVLKHFPSFKTFPAAASMAADIELLAASSDNSSDCGVLGMSDRPLDATLPMAFDDVLATHGAVAIPRGDAASIDAHVRGLVCHHALEDNFYVLDLGALQRLWRAWGEAMPRVHPHYAVKCNNDPALLGALAALGVAFDCASSAEIEQILSIGVSPDRIVFANPCKRPADVRSAASKGVTLCTFDNEAELLKLQRWAPDTMRVLLRIRADDPMARCPLGNKFGAEEREWEALLSAARRYGVPVDGVSFHVGSGATNPEAFSYAIELARRAFDLGAAYGFDMHVLDIGGGFCGGRFGPDGRVDLGGVPAAVNSALARHFPEGLGVRIIAEPGRYFAEATATLATFVYGRRCREREPGGDLSYDYWITDGLYGSMNCLLYDHATVMPRPLDPSVGPTLPSTVFGPTCDGLDTVVRDYPLPEMHVGDWLVFPHMGAYTLCGASKFNGINAVDVPTFYICSARP